MAEVCTDREAATLREGLCLVDKIIRMDDFSRNWRQLKHHNPRGWIGHQPAGRERKPNER